VKNSDQLNKNSTWKSILTIDGKIIQPNPREYLTNETPEINQSSDYLEWTGDNSTSSNIRFLESKTPDTLPNSLSVVNDVVYLGSGSEVKSIGNIDSTFNGLNGNSLRVNLEKIPTAVTVSKTITVPVTSTVTVPVTSVIKVPVISTEIVAVTNTIKVPVTKIVTVPAEYTNGDFEQFKSDGTPRGWAVSNSTTYLNGNTLIGGFPTPIDATIPGNSPGDQVYAAQGNFTSNSNSTYSTSGSSSYQLSSNGSVIDMPYGVLRGPYMVSEEALKLNTGDSVSFDWKAQGSDDAYDVYGYLLNIDNGETIKLIDDTAATGSGTTAWENINQTIPSDGTYKFVFVSGSYDATGGMVVGARLLIDNVKITTSNTMTKEVTIIEDQEVVTYEEREVTTYEDREVITYEQKEVTTYKDEIIESTSIENIAPSEYFILARNLYTQYTHLQTDTDGIIEFDGQGNINKDLSSITYKSPYGTSTSLTINSGKSTQYSNPYSQFSLEQDGVPEGTLADLSIKNNGVIEALYSNGYKDTIGKIMLADFANVGGLQQLGDTRYKSTGASGTANYGEAGINRLGGIKSAARERSNVDLTTEMVGLIMAQRNFQANAKALETNFALQKNMIDNIQ
jgi:flagellar hook-basal body protein